MDGSSWRYSPVRISGEGGYDRESRRWKPLDVALVLLLTAVAAFTAFLDLGDRTAAQTFWKPSVVGEGFTVDFGKLRTVDRLNMYEGPGARGKTRVEWSADGQRWELYAEVEHSTNRVFTWKSEDKTVEARYMRFTADSVGYRLYEAAFFTNGVTVPVPVDQVIDNGTRGNGTEGTPSLAFDEQEFAPYRPDYRNSMYFDEIYHGRTAYEFEHNMEPYENTHPPLGKVILELGVHWFGMTPFGWRFMAAVGGTLMVPVMYAAAKGMFGRTRYAFLAGLLLVLEGFHLVQSRITNVDIFGVTFTILMYYGMFRYGETRWRYRGFSSGLGWLAMSGFFFGCAAAVKWNYLYGGAGLAVLFLLALVRKLRHARDEGLRHPLKRTVLTLMTAVLFFIVVPGGIYTASYIPYLKSTQAEDSYKDLWQYQKNMYNYHKGVKEDHPYASKWYTWPLMLRPVWYYGGKDLAPGDAQSIAAIGNPLVWWGGLLAMLASWWLGWLRRDRIVLTLGIMYLSFYVPWMVAPRSITFLYHYFPMVPLLIFSLVWIFRLWEEESREGRRATVLTVVLAAGLFIWFYPVYTGLTISREWMNLFIRWLPSWGF